MGANAYTSRGRSVRYLIRFSVDEKRALDARAASEGKPLADLIRASLGLAEAPPVAFEARVCRHCGQLVARDGVKDARGHVQHRACVRETMGNGHG